MQSSISYSYSFTDNGKVWLLNYARGSLYIHTEGGVNLRLNYLADEIPKYSENYKTNNGILNTWGELETRGFNLTAFTYQGGPELDSFQNEGIVEVYFNATEYTGYHSLLFAVPYLLAKGLMTLGRGETELEGANIIVPPSTEFRIAKQFGDKNS
jgi:hypothetical protein